jgi:hypothetical protein
MGPPPNPTLLWLLELPLEVLIELGLEEVLWLALPLEDEEELEEMLGELGEVLGELVVVWVGGVDVEVTVGERCALTTREPNRRPATKLYSRIEHLPGN